MRVLGNWQLGRSRTDLSLSSQKNKMGGSGERGREGRHGGMICISLSA